MKLFLAISVVIIALALLAGPSSAQFGGSPMKSMMDSLSSSMKGIANKAGETLKSAFQGAGNIGTNTRTAFSGITNKLKDKFSKK